MVCCLAMPDEPEKIPEKITLDRLENQADWYSCKSKRAQRIYKWLKGVEIVAAALIPFLAGRNFAHHVVVVGGLGVLITIFEGILQLNQYQRIWPMYRATSEALTHEKFLYLAKAGPYSVADPDAARMLAVRIETIMSQENTKWVSVQEQSGKAQGSGSKDS